MLTRRVALSPASAGRPLPPPGVCRKCGRTSLEARFHPLNRAICAACSDEAKADRAERQAGREPAAAPKRLPGLRAGRHPEHLAWVRTQPCACRRPGCGVAGARHAHHVRTGGTGGGTGMKPGDQWTVPLTPLCHLRVHQEGARTFERAHGVDLHVEAERLAALSPHLPKP